MIRATERRELGLYQAFRVVILSELFCACWLMCGCESMSVCVEESCLTLALVIKKWQGCGIVVKPHSPQVIWCYQNPPPQSPLGVVLNHTSIGQFTTDGNH